MSEAIIVKIDLSTPPEEFIRRHLGKQSLETKKRIEQVVHEKQLVDQASRAVKDKNDKKDQIVDDIFTRLRNQGDSGLPKKEVITAMVAAEIAKSSSGVTLKLKSMIAKNMPNHELVASKDKYIIVASTPTA